MRIALMQADLPSESNGGVAYQVHRLANELSKSNEVTIFAVSKKPLDANYEVKQIFVPTAIKKNALLKPLYFSLALAFQDFSAYDVIHAHGDSQFLIGKKVLRTFHGSALDEAIHAGKFLRFLRFLFLFPLEFLSGVVAKTSIGVSIATKKRHQFIKKVIPNGVDLKEFRPGKKSENPSILFVGTIKGRKRGELLLEAFRKRVLNEVPNAELWMVCDKKFEEKNTKFFGRVSNGRLAELFRKAWVFCMPSSYEGFGIPYIEAMASGTVVITTPNAGAKEVLDNGKYGIVVEEEMLGDALVEILRNKSRRHALTSKAHAYVKKYSIDNVVREYLREYKLLSGTNFVSHRNNYNCNS